MRSVRRRAVVGRSGCSRCSQPVLAGPRVRPGRLAATSAPACCRSGAARPQARPSLRSPLALAWRLHRGLLLGWVVGLALAGRRVGRRRRTASRTASPPNQQLTDMLARMGGHKGLADAFLGRRVRHHRAWSPPPTRCRRPCGCGRRRPSGRVEPLLATRVGRLRWALSHLVFALLGTAVLLAAAGSGGRAGLRQRRSTTSAGRSARLLAAALVQLPADLGAGRPGHRPVRPGAPAERRWPGPG